LKSYREIANARRDGKLLCIGNRGGFPDTLLTGFRCEFLGVPDCGASIGSQPEFALRAVEAAEQAGYSRDLCAYNRAFLGSALRGEYVFGGEFPKPDFIFTPLPCDNNGKIGQALSEFYGVPFIGIDVPVLWELSNGYAPHQVDYVVDQFHQGIATIERLFGQQYDDEKLYEGIYNRCACEVLWAEIAMLNQRTPVPVDLKSQYALMAPLVNRKHKAETVQFYRELLQEVEDRVAHGIAAVAEERVRLAHDGIPAWHSLWLFRWAEGFGVAFIGGHYTIVGFGAFDIGKDGRLQPRKPPQEMGVSFRDREEALRFLAEWFLHTITIGGHMIRPRRSCQVHLCREWQAQGLIYHLNRGCPAFTAGALETKMVLEKELGIPVLVYEASSTDPRDFDRAAIVDRWEAFFEQMGLRRKEA
jgi:benzoyl-CoA reductase subunit B